MSNARRREFIAYLAAQELTEVDVAVALLWFESHEDHHQSELTGRQLADLLAADRLRANVNVSRLGAKLARHADVVRGRAAGTFRIRAGSDRVLSERFQAHRRAENIFVSETILPTSIPLGGRKHLEALRREINGTYEYGFYNSCAVMCRRLAEILLIEAFNSAGQIDLIRDVKGNLITFGDILLALGGQSVVKLSRGAPKALDRLKQTGDGAAHSRHYNASRNDIDDLNPSFRQLIAELSALAKLS
ncbi:hypothetical protein [Phenylobacterium sp. SCN 70-31]|uniref:hypothetical protein n=1 Tax=Phenylobacterium sp. SCN 70-31 TaxID=1660129 RepID=UPI0025CC5BE4|nr:hypothetical protein [Phenylobacterium sp. SCN 70-31]